MTRSRHETLPTLLPWLPRVLWQWLATGLALYALLVLCDAPWPDGPWLYWAVLAPASALLTLYRHAVAAAWRGLLVSAPRRRRPRRAGAQARRTGFGAPARRQAPRAA